MDLRQKALRLAGRVIEFDPDVRGGDGFAIARDILDSGRALAQDEPDHRCAGPAAVRLAAPPVAPLSFEVVGAARRRGHRRSTTCALARIAQLAGAPKVPGAGVDLLRRLGDAVTAGEPLYRVHARFEADLDFARRKARRRQRASASARADELPRDFVAHDGGAEF